MKVLYISSRLNVPDGSSVHGRAFVASVIKLGHEIHTYPEIGSLPEVYSKPNFKKKDLNFYFRKLRPESVLGKIRSLDYRISILFAFFGGLTDSIRDYFRIRKIVKEFKPDIIVYRQYLYNYAPIWAAKVSGLSTVAEVNSIKSVEIGLSQNNPPWMSVVKWAEKYPLIRSDKIFCVSSAIKKDLDQIVNGNLVSVIPNGVDGDVFDRNAYDPRKIKEELGIAGKTVLGYAGSYKSWHGVSLTVNVIEKLRNTHPDFHLLLIGRGETFQKVKEQIQINKLESFVTQIDYVPHAEMPKYLSIIDVALMTYPIFEGFYFSPLKMYEYMAVGMPVVSTNIGQIGDVIENDKTGVLVDDPTADNFVLAILSITEHTDNLAKISAYSRKVAIEKHSWIVNAKAVLELAETKNQA